MSDNKRVAIIGARGYPSFYGGFETLLRHLIPYLAENSWDVDVYCRDGTGTIPVTENETIEFGNVKQIYTRGIESKSLSTLSHGLTSSVNAAWRKPDAALVLNVANGFWLPLLRARGIPTAVNVDGIEWDRAKWGRAAKKVFLAGARLTAHHATTVVYDAREIERRWHEQFGRDGVFIPYGGSPVDSLPPHKNHPAGTYVLYVARFVPENSIQQFIEAADELSSHAEVVIVGSSGYGGPIEEQVRAAAGRNARITWLGHINDDRQLHSLWANAGAYFHGHSVGGTNPALVQAMACGAPVVARDTSYNREVLGRGALFARPESSHIVEQVATVLRDPALRDRLRKESRARQAENYTWELVCERYDRLLTSILGGHRGQQCDRWWAPKPASPERQAEAS